MKRPHTGTTPALVLFPGLIGSWAGTFGWWPLAVGAGLAVGLAVFYADDIFSPVSVDYRDVADLATEIGHYRFVVGFGAFFFGAAAALCLPILGLVATMQVGGCVLLAFSGLLARYAWLRHRWRQVMAAQAPTRRSH